VRLEVNDMNNESSANEETYEFYRKYGYELENKFMWRYFITKEPTLIVIIYGKFITKRL